MDSISRTSLRHPELIFADVARGRMFTHFITALDMHLGTARANSGSSYRPVRKTSEFCGSYAAIPFDA